MKILTGIVTYEPDMARLEENIKNISVQHTDIIIFDNGSQNISKIKRATEKYHARIISAKENLGVAYALKKIMEYAIKCKYEWVLSFDQDSVPDTKIISEYTRSIPRCEHLGALTCNIIDRNFAPIDNDARNEIIEVDKCITTGFFVNVFAYTKTAGYDSRMFIDEVDFDICYCLRENGYKIYRIPYNGVLHEVGKGQNVRFFGLKTVIYNEKPLRHYYMRRNSIYVARKHRDSISILKTIVNQIWAMILVMCFEDNKLKKLYYSMKGLGAGFYF